MKVDKLGGSGHLPQRDDVGDKAIIPHPFFAEKDLIAAKKALAGVENGADMTKQYKDALTAITNLVNDCGGRETKKGAEAQAILDKFMDNVRLESDASGNITYHALDIRSVDDALHHFHIL